MSTATDIKWRPILIFAAVALILLVIMPLDVSHYRLAGEFFNSGHIVLFFVLAIILMRHVPKLRRTSFAGQLGLIVAVSVITGTLTEGLQLLTGRLASVRDVGLDISGAVLAVAFFSQQIKYINYRLRNMIRISSVLLMLLMMWPGFVAVADTVLMYRQFPVLSNMSSFTEMSRWQSGINNLAREYMPQEQRYRLRADLKVAKFAGISLDYIVGDWQNYNKLIFELYNPQQEILTINFRVHDQTHAQGNQDYSDRFNYHTQLKPGGNRFVVSTKEIESAPSKRRLNLKDVANIGIFVTGLTKPATIYLDRVFLE
jgi:VanZ family protein